VCICGYICYLLVLELVYRMYIKIICVYKFFLKAEDGIRDRNVTGVQTCALPILKKPLEAFKSFLGAFKLFSGSLMPKSNLKRECPSTRSDFFLAKMHFVLHGFPNGVR